MNPNTPNLFNMLLSMFTTFRERMTWAAKNMLHEGYEFSFGPDSITIWIENFPTVNWEFHYTKEGSIELYDMIWTIEGA